jgi:ribosomal RNA-processing protein 7
MSASASLIKGFLPVRLFIPSQDNETMEATFFYVKEHRDNNNSSTTSDTKGTTTLFVVNAPVVLGVRTRLVLQSLLGCFGEICRITVVPTTTFRPQQPESLLVSKLVPWTNNTKFRLPSFLPPVYSEGKFAHVVFASHKDMKRAMRGLTKIMADNHGIGVSDGVENKVSKRLPGLVLDNTEIQALADESDRQYREETGGAEQEEDVESKIGAGTRAASSAVLILAERYRTSVNRLSRDALLEECNAVMQEFETEEQKDREKRASEANEPDEDGFVVVSYAAQVGSKKDLEENARAQRRGKGQKRARKKKGSGAEAMSNFYRFQTKDTRKRSIQDLRRKFEDDLVKVKKMKEDKEYRPF